jgi:hypothetical protein
MAAASVLEALVLIGMGVAGFMAFLDERNRNGPFVAGLDMIARVARVIGRVGRALSLSKASAGLCKYEQTSDFAAAKLSTETNAYRRI